MAFYILQKDETKGPYTIGQLRSLWSSGAITSDTLFCEEGYDQWWLLRGIVNQLEPTPPRIAVVPAKPVAKRLSFSTALVLSVIFGALILFIVSQTDFKVTDSGQTEGVIYDTTTKIVTQSLTSPSTAKFPSYHWDDGAVTFVSLGNRRYSISSYVDSQNSFGAMVRTKWTAVVSVTGKTVRIEEYQSK